MKKLLTLIDICWTIIVPLIACGYLVFNESEHSTYIIAVGWLMFLLHGVGTANSFKSHDSIWPVVWSLLNTTVLLICLYYGVLEIEGFLILELVCETASYLAAILIFVISNQKINGESFWKKMGPGIAIMNLIIISAVIYPFIAEWLIYIGKKADGTIYWIAAGSTFLIAVIKKTSVLKEVVLNVNSPQKPSSESDSSVEPAKKSNWMGAVFAIFMVIWFVGLAILKNIR